MSSLSWQLYDVRVEWRSAVDLSGVPFISVISPFESTIVVSSLNATDLRAFRSGSTDPCIGE